MPTRADNIGYVVDIPSSFPAPTPSLRAGQLLIATPALVDPNFDHAVVLLLEHDEGGSLGVVVNRPSQVAVGAILPEWGEAASEPGVMFQGGPVSTDSALALATWAGVGESPVGYRELFDGTGIFDLDTPSEVLLPALTQVRVFAGYAGWGAGQLDAEIEEGSWFVVPSTSTDLFGADPETLWGRVLRRQPGELAWLSTMPADPTMN